ncbi:hypothetical protein ACFQX6_67645 [Streptosporangium lutulentum]
MRDEIAERYGIELPMTPLRGELARLLAAPGASGAEPTLEQELAPAAAESSATRSSTPKGCPYGPIQRPSRPKSWSRKAPRWSCLPPSGSRPTHVCALPGNNRRRSSPAMK